MALLFKNPDGTYATKCALCGETLSDPIFATTHFISNKSHPFYRFSDAAMHWNCYVKWADQPRFASMYFEAGLQKTNPPWTKYWKTLLKTADVFVQYGFAVNEISVLLRKSGTNLRIHRSRWQTWLSGSWRTDCRPELEVEALGDILPRLRELQIPEPLDD
jgi:hypothetical protein